MLVFPQQNYRAHKSDITVPKENTLEVPKVLHVFHAKKRWMSKLEEYRRYDCLTFEVDFSVSPPVPDSAYLTVTPAKDNSCLLKSACP